MMMTCRRSLLASSADTGHDGSRFTFGNHNAQYVSGVEHPQHVCRCINTNRRRRKHWQCLVARKAWLEYWSGTEHLHHSCGSENTISRHAHD